MYTFEQIPMQGFPARGPISETRCVHDFVDKFLKQRGYEVHHESNAFKVPHTAYRVLLRVDFLAFSRNTILIVECKGAPFRRAQVFGAMLQLTLYMRLYRMLQLTPNPQLHFKDLNPSSVREGVLHGVLAIPQVALNREKLALVEKTLLALGKVQLLEENMHLWALAPKKRPTSA